MRRVLLAVTVLLTVTVSPTFAGYIIIRVLLEGNGSGNNTAPGGPPGMGTPSGPPTGSGSGYPGGQNMNGPGRRPGMSGLGGPPDAQTHAHPDEMDHTRSVVVVIPLETDLLHSRLDTTKHSDDKNNPQYYKFAAPYYGRKLVASLFVDTSSIQLYKDLIDKPAPRKTRFTELREKYQSWQRGKTDPRLLYDAMILALESGVIRDTTVYKDNSPPIDATTCAEELLAVAAEKKLTLPNEVQQFVTAWEPIHKAVKAPASQPSTGETWRVRLNATNARVDGHYAIVYWDSLESEVLRRAAQLNDNFTAFFLWHATRGVSLPVPEKPLLVVLAKDVDQVGQLRYGLDGLPSPADAFYAPDHNIVVLAPDRMDGVGKTFLRQTKQLFSKGLNPDELTAGKIPKIDATGAKGSKPDDIARAATLAVVEKLVVDEAELAAVSREGSNQLLFTTGVLPTHVTLPNWLTQGAANFYTRPRGPAYVTKGDDAKPYMTIAFSTGYNLPNYVLQRYFTEMGDPFHKELNPDHVQLLENILTDAYFTGLKEAIDPDPAPPVKFKKPHPTGGTPNPGGPSPAPKGPAGPMGFGPAAPGPMGPGGMKPGGMGSAGMGPGATGASATVMGDLEDPVVAQRKKRDRLNIKAQSTAWALYFYLVRARPAELKQYIAELNKLPRDLPIDGRTAHTAFVRVFKLSATDGGPADPALLKKFAKDWLDYMATVPVVGIDIPLILPEPPKKEPGMGPGMSPGIGGPQTGK